MKKTFVKRQEQEKGWPLEANFHQASNGGLPFAGPAAFIYGSDTYHIATMLGTYEYLLWTNDGPWLNYVYPKYQAAMAFIIGKMDGSGMLEVTGVNDWGRNYQGGHK